MKTNNLPEEIKTRLIKQEAFAKKYAELDTIDQMCIAAQIDALLQRQQLDNILKIEKRTA